MDTKEKTRENYYRRMAERQGLTLKKSRARKWSIDNYQGYMIVNAFLNTIEAGQKFDLSLDEVAEYLEENEKRIKG